MARTPAAWLRHEQRDSGKGVDWWAMAHLHGGADPGVAGAKEPSPGMALFQREDYDMGQLLYLQLLLCVAW